MRIAALEGPSFAGKTSTLAALGPLLHPLRVISYACYVDEIASNDVPPARARGAAEQLAAFELFMEIEADRVADLRCRGDGADLLLLDRSVDTLLAHAYALDRLYAYGVHDAARSLLPQREHLCPDRTFYLDAGPEVLQRRRRRSGGPFDDFLLDPVFVGHFRDYFTLKGSPISAWVSIVHAEQEQSIVADRIVRMLAQEGEEVAWGSESSDRREPGPAIS